MLAKPEVAERPTPPAPEEKRRTVTLTNARPVTFYEHLWPVIAEGTHEDEHPSGCESLKIDFRVRCEQRPGTGISSTPQSLPFFSFEPRHLIHGKFAYWNEFGDGDGSGQLVRVGRLLEPRESVEKALLEVGQEMKERVVSKDGYMHKWVTLAVDRCFAKLAARTI